MIVGDIPEIDDGPSSPTVHSLYESGKGEPCNLLFSRGPHFLSLFELSEALKDAFILGLS